MLITTLKANDFDEKPKLSFNLEFVTVLDENNKALIKNSKHETINNTEITQILSWFYLNSSNGEIKINKKENKKYSENIVSLNIVGF